MVASRPVPVPLVLVIAAALYLTASIVSAALADVATSNQMRFIWRLSAFAVSGLVCALHVLYELKQRDATARAAEWRATAGAALGGLAIALAANFHDLGSAAGYRPKMLIALAAWPVITALPAFIVATVVARLFRRTLREGNPT